MDQRETPLADAASAFLAAEITPFTTPGHKRVPHLADEFLLFDLPLSSGADDLHMRSDVLGKAERLAASLWGAELCRFCANGSTQGNQALALALGRPGDPVVVSRSLHKSVLAGLVLSGLEPVWVRPDVDPATGLPLALPPDRVAAALADAPAACGIFLVEPSFVGVLSDVAAIAEIAHEGGVPLVVDQAWGAHFGFHPDLPPHALAAGADAFVASAHKTLAAFTQSAFLLARGGFLDLERLDEAFELLHTTSPSGALLASLDRARMIMATRGEELLGETLRLAEVARRRLAEVEGLVVADSDDPTKLALSLPGTGADGLEVEADLFAAGHPLRARQPRSARPAPDDRGHGGRYRAALRRARRLDRATPGRAPFARRRERGLGRHTGDRDDASGSVLLRPGDRVGRGRGRPRRRGDGRPVSAGNPGDRTRRGRLPGARRGAAAGGRGRHPPRVLRRSRARHAAGRRARLSRLPPICYKEA